VWQSLAGKPIPQAFVNSYRYSSQEMIITVSVVCIFAPSDSQQSVIYITITGFAQVF